MSKRVFEIETVGIDERVVEHALIRTGCTDVEVRDITAEVKWLQSAEKAIGELWKIYMKGIA